MCLRFSLPLFAVICFACNRQPQQTGNTPSQADQTGTLPASETLPSGFLTFYEKFHADSLYQMSHINWPLQGDKSVPVDSTTLQLQEVYWEARNWRMHRANFDLNDYRIERQTIGDIMVVERVMAKAVNYGIERRFAKQPDGEWALIFYSDMRER